VEPHNERKVRSYGSEEEPNLPKDGFGCGAVPKAYPLTLQAPTPKSGRVEPHNERGVVLHTSAKIR